MQKQFFLAPHGTATIYSKEETHRKLEEESHCIIRSELDVRANYLKNLLENEHERLEYASQKELKTMKQ